MNNSAITWITETPKPEAHSYNTRNRNNGKLMIITTVLPMEVVMYGILTRVPADHWEKTLNQICKGWSAIPRDPFFQNMHFHGCKLGLYIQDQLRINSGTQFIQIEEKKAKVAFRRTIPGQVCDSLDGLLLIRRSSDEPRNVNGNFYAANPATKQVVKLAFDFEQDIMYFTCKGKIVSIDGKFKVVFLGSSNIEERYQYRWYIYSMESGMHGLIPYRKVTCPDSIAINDMFYPHNTISTGAVTYWSNIYDGMTLAFDARNETCYSLVLPGDTNGTKWQIVKNGDQLGFVTWSYNDREIGMWALKDLQNSIWIKTGTIVADRRSSNTNIDRGLIHSANFLYDQQILVFVICLSLRKMILKLVAFDVKTGSIRTLRKIPKFSEVGLHINSLITL
ncbi:hypothetical protein L6164_008825 [Bauhinia variegata]|uniref:Uncharacterized protein n=1 Tax=Bauhinia variegata TaxID=167791 RepID=A0ACB9PHV6_BAUVA|nr:hypothetical protein L6164_008825 [Bauhinia variegata]